MPFFRFRKVVPTGTVFESHLRIKICRLKPRDLKALPNDIQLRVSECEIEILNFSTQYSRALSVAMVLTDVLTNADSMGTL